MVTKHPFHSMIHTFRSVLAKIHMVTKLLITANKPQTSSVLAKIHMVTKLPFPQNLETLSSVLAKIHMVTKRIFF